MGIFTLIVSQILVAVGDATVTDQNNGIMCTTSNSKFDLTVGRCVCMEQHACMTTTTPCGLGQIRRRTAKLPRYYITPDLIPTNCSEPHCLCRRVQGNVPVAAQVRARSVFATVPRSGNTWMRRMLERASRIPTHTVYSGERIKKRDSSISQYSGTEHTPLNNLSGLFYQPCGLENDCDLIPHLTQLPRTVFAKTHSPFVETDKIHKGSDVGIGVAALIAIRNPLDNFEAWWRYSVTKKRTDSEFDSKIDHSSRSNFQTFFNDWTHHVQFWINNADFHKVPTIFYRYEDLMHEECRTSIIKAALQDSGAWNELGLSDYDVEQGSRDYPPSKEMAEATHVSKGKMGETYSQEEIKTAIASPLVQLFGYDKLYESWLEPNVQMHGTSPLSQWKGDANCIYRRP